MKKKLIDADTIRRHATSLAALPKDTLLLVLDALRVRAMDDVTDVLHEDDADSPKATPSDMACDVFLALASVKGDPFLAATYGRDEVRLKAWVGRPDVKATALEDAQRNAANLLGEIADDPDVMAAIKKASPETAKDVKDTHAAWKDAGEAFLRSIGAPPPITFPKGSILVVSWQATEDEEAEERRGVVTESKPDEVTIKFEDDEDDDSYAFEKVEGGWVEINESGALVQIDYERDEPETDEENGNDEH